MKEWSLEHPYLATFVSLVAILSAADVARGIISALKRPQPVTLNVNQREESEAESVRDISGLN